MPKSLFFVCVLLLGLLSCQDDSDDSSSSSTTPVYEYVNTFAGTGAAGMQDSDVLSAASFNQPRGIAADSTGNLWIADTNNSMIRKISPEGVVSSVPLAPNTLNKPFAITFYKDALYVADTFNHQIQKIQLPDFTLTTLAGNGVAGNADGEGTLARFNRPMGIVVEPKSERIFVADFGNNLIRSMNLQGLVTTVAGSQTAGAQDAVGLQSSFAGPRGLALDATYLYISDFSNHTIRKMDFTTFAVTTVAGQAEMFGYKDAAGSDALFFGPDGLFFVPKNKLLYISDSLNQRIRRLELANNQVTTKAGTGVRGSAQGQTDYASFNSPAGLLVNDAGVLLIADTGNNTIRQIK